MKDKRNKLNILFALLLGVFVTVFSSCEDKRKVEAKNATGTNMDSLKQDEKVAKAILMDLLESLEHKDLKKLTNIMSASEEMNLIFTNGNTLKDVDSFIEFHRTWFKDTTWTMTHELVDFNFYGNFVTSTVKAFYEEPLREGKPYHHYMLVSYVLRKSDDGEWMIIKDQSTTFDKTMD